MDKARFDVTVVVCTRDRPVLLERLLRTLERQRTDLHYEILVVYNGEPSPAGLHKVRTIHEPRKGLSYARNAGIRAANATVIAFADDDMEAPDDWLDTLVKPIFDHGTAVCIGLTEPMKVDTPAERIFEAYGGHGYSRDSRLFDAAWLAAQRWHLPMWEVGPLGNSAIRREVFDSVGYFNAALGAGTPVGSWEDLELTYRILKAGHRIHFDRRAKVVHAHREDMAGLTQQLCAYRRGEVCFCLLIAARYRDWRAVTHLLLWIPLWRARLAGSECLRRIQGQRQFDFAVMVRETWAYVTAPAALIASLRRRRLLANPPDGE